MTATAVSTHRPQGFGTAFRHQLDLLWATRRPLVLLVAVVGLMVLGGEPWNGSPLARLLTAPIWPLWLVIVGPVWAFAVWYNEGPSSRLYHWSQPVSRTAHSLARVAAGAAWLWAIAILLVAAGITFAAFEGEAWQLAEIGTAGWVNFFTGPLIGYLILSVLTIASDYPVRWFFGLAFLIPILLSVMVEWLGLEALVRTILKPLAESWGIAITMIGGFMSELAPLEESLRRLETTGPVGLVRVDDHPGGFDRSTWIAATIFWTVFWSGAVAALATRHPDVFPRWRRSG